MLRAIASALGMPLGPLLTRVGMLEPGDAGEPPPRETEAAILRDPELSEPQRIALLSVYRSFMAANPAADRFAKRTLDIVRR